MPAITIGDRGRATRAERMTSVRSANYDYEYPDGLNLKPGTKFHDELVSKLWTRANDAHTAISNRFDAWNQIDRTLTTYIDLTETEKNLDANKPVSIVFPNSYAILETMLSYMVMAFFQDPIFRYVGSGPEDTIGAILMEKVIQQHCEYNKVPLALHTMFRDNFSYGLGVVVPTWKVHTGMKPVITDINTRNWMGQAKKTGQEINFERGVIHEGNALENIDPYLYLPDPNVSVDKVQDGEFVGWINRTNLMEVLSQELDDPDMFNARYLKHLRDAETSIITSDENERGLKTNRTDRKRNEDQHANKVDIISLYVKLIPSEWNLGNNDYPETWMFEIAGDTVIIKAREAGAMHGRFPVGVTASEYDGYSNTPISRIEVMDGMQNVLNWLFNSHIANVRKAMNDMFVVDPYLVNINDLKDPKPGKLIRMRRPAWGRGVQNAVQQFAVTDVTRGNMVDTGIISQLMQTLSGTDNPVMGSLRQGGPERLTGAEFQGTMAGAVSRLERVARISSYQGLQDIAMMFASHTQQLMDNDTYVRTIGTWPEVLRKNFGVQNEPIPVTPFDLIVDYDVRIRDGSIPGGNFSQAWIQLYQIMAGNPELSSKFDMVRIFKHIATNLGAKNVSNFEKQVMPTVSTAPDDVVAEQAQAGNLQPITGA